MNGTSIGRAEVKGAEKIGGGIGIGNSIRRCKMSGKRISSMSESRESSSMHCS